MEETLLAKEYLNRIKKFINKNADLTFLQYKFVKMSRLEDLIACFLGAVPESYRNALKNKHKSTYHSILAYSTFTRLINRVFFLFPQCYMVNYGEANHLIDVMLSSIEYDINDIEEKSY